MKNNSFEEIISLFRNVQRVTLISHRRPDGDTLGASLALHFALQKLGKQTTLACIDQPSKRFSFLPDIEKLKRHFLYDAQDLLIVSDAGESKMTGYHEIIPEFLLNDIPILNIDHHISNNYFGKYNFVDPKAASTTVIVYELLQAMEIEIDKAIATCLLTGIYNDTGGFMHSNTDLRVFKAAADLASYGASSTTISRFLLREKSFEQLKVWGLALNRLRRNEERVVSSILKLDEIHSCGATSDETGGVIDLINTIADAKFAVLVAEDEKGFVKGSFRTQHDDVDVSKIAAQFGGGGHRKAAGFRIPGKIREEKVWKVVQE